MLSCEQVIQDIRSFLDREPTECNLEHIQKHLDLCRSCFSKVEFEKFLKDAMQKKTNHCCPSQLKDRIKNLIDKF